MGLLNMGAQKRQRVQQRLPETWMAASQKRLHLWAGQPAAPQEDMLPRRLLPHGSLAQGRYAHRDLLSHGGHTSGVHAHGTGAEGRGPHRHSAQRAHTRRQRTQG